MCNYVSKDRTGIKELAGAGGESLGANFAMPNCETAKHELHRRHLKRFECLSWGLGCHQRRPVKRVCYLKAVSELRLVEGRRGHDELRVRELRLGRAVTWIRAVIDSYHNMNTEQRFQSKGMENIIPTAIAMTISDQHRPDSKRPDAAPVSER